MSGFASAAFLRPAGSSLQPQIVLLIEKALLLDAGHVQHIQPGQLGFQIGGLLVGLVQRGQSLVLEVLRDAQLLRRDEHEPVALELAQRGGEGVHRPAEFQVAAETDGQMIQPPLALADGHQVDHGLGGMCVAAVTGIDHRHAAHWEARSGAPSLGWRMAMMSA